MATLQDLRGNDAALTERQQHEIRIAADTLGGFEAMQRMARLFASSQIVPTTYQGNIPNCFIALDMALRLKANPMAVMQNLYLVHGRPAWSAQFLIATLNQCGRFSAIRYEFQGTEGADDWGCRAVATELSSSEKLSGPLITIALAKKEGWYGKAGSKWQSMPELMLRYRAASWFVRAYAPEIAMGLHTAEEVQDTYDLEPAQDGSYQVSLQEMKEAKEEPSTDTGQQPAQNAEVEANGKAQTAEKSSRANLAEKRQIAVAAWTATGNPLEDAERLVNEFSHRWNSVQCEKIMALAQEARESGAAPANAEADGE